VKRIILLVVVLFAIGGAIWHTNYNVSANSQQAAVQPPQTIKKASLNGTKDKGDHKSLVVYYSLTGNTKQIAQHIHAFVGGDIFELQTSQLYPKEHDPLIAQAKKELQDAYLPELKGRLENINDYDVVYIGSPIWWGTDAPAVRTFLSQNNLTGKIVIPFVTHASVARNGGPGSGISDIASQAKGAKPLEGAHFYEDKVSDKQAVEDWLKRIGMLK